MINISFVIHYHHIYQHQISLSFPTKYIIIYPRQQNYIMLTVNFLKFESKKESKTNLIIHKIPTYSKTQLMLKQQRITNLVHQSTILTKKQKKRSSSTSRNKENISISHNQSSSIEYSQVQDKGQLNCNNKKIVMKEKSKKQMITVCKQRSISRMSNLTSTLQIIQPSKIKIFENKQVQAVSKKAKAKNLDSHQSHVKSPIIHDQSSQIQAKFHKKQMRNLLNKPEMSSSSTIMSVSTGNIKFSDRSREDQKMRVFELPSQERFDQVQMGPKHARKLPSSNFSFKSQQKRLNPTKAAIMIQKTWRGYLTRQLLSQYINSFEPLYQQQLKQIRSNRQSSHEIGKFSTKRQQERSSFFDQTRMGNETQQSGMSQLEGIRKSQDSSLQNERSTKTSINMRDLPLQYSNKAHINSNSNDRSRSTQLRAVTPFQKGFNSKVSEFTIKNSTQLQHNHKLIPNSIISNHQTMKITNRKFKHFSILKTVQLSINLSSSNLNSSSIDSLHYHCEALEKLFVSMKLSCIAELKKEIKDNNLNLNELVERKDALMDIVENGREFVKNVEEEMAKAFEEMKRITVNGCGHEQSQASSESERRQQSIIKPQHRKASSQPSFLQQTPFTTYPLQPPSSKPQPHFQKIQLPTQQYSISSRSPPIQEQYSQQQLSSQDLQLYDESDRQSSSFKQDSQCNYNDNSNNTVEPLNEHSIEILNQFLVNLIDEYTQQLQQKDISELQYLCQTLKRVSCDGQSKTIIDRCLIQFIVEIMSQTWTLRQLYDAFRAIVANSFNQLDKQFNQNNWQMEKEMSDDWKLYSMIRRWLGELEKWEMNIINEVPAKMESSSFINTAENISFNQLRQSPNSPFNKSNLDI